MTDTFATPNEFANELTSADLHSSYGDFVGATAKDALDPKNSLSGMWLFRRLREAHAGGDDLAVGSNGEIDAFGGQSIEEQQAVIDRQRAAIPDTSIEDAKARVKQEGLEGHLKLPDQPSIKSPVLDLMVSEAHERRDREAAIARGPQGFVPGALGFVTSIGAGMIDPVNAAAFSIPVLGEARWGKLLASAGDSIAARAGMRALQGGLQGGVGTAVLQPADWWLHTQDGQDYTFADALKSIAMGAGMGAAFHAGFGAFGDFRARLRGEPLEGAPPLTAKMETDARLLPPLPQEVISDLPPGAREDALHSAISDVINGRPVRTADMLSIAADHDPRIAESFEPSRSLDDEFGAVGLSSEARQWPELPQGAELTRHGNFGPEVAGLEGRWSEAVGWLKEAQSGDARAVLEHPGVPGPIDVVWGNKDFGLEHIMVLHPEVVADLPERLARMKVERVLQEGRPGERIVLTSPDRAETAVIRTGFDGEKKTWLLTAYTPESDRRGRGGDTTGSPPNDRPTRSSAAPEGNIGPESPARNPGHGEASAAAARDPRWNELSGAAEDPRDVAESRTAAELPEPSSLVPEKSMSALETAAADAEEVWRQIAPNLSEEERAVVTDALKAIDQDRDARAQIIKDGAACLLAAIG